MNTNTEKLAAEFYSQFVRPKPGLALVVGSKIYPGRSDRRALFDRAVGWDALVGPGVDHVVDLSFPIRHTGTPFAGTFSHVDCVSVLEHCRNPWQMAENLQDLLEPNGTLFYSSPFAWRVHAYPDDFWRFTISGVKLLFPRINWHALRYSHKVLAEESVKTPQIEIKGNYYVARTEVYGFGSLV